jgi:hypothetical protein
MDGNLFDMKGVTGFEGVVSSLGGGRSLRVPSAPALFDLIAVDTFFTRRKVRNMIDYITLPIPSMGSGSTAGVPHLMLINIMAPWYEPAMFGGDLDGEGHSLIFYGQITESTVRQLTGKEPKTPAVELLRKFCNDETDKNRLKIIPTLVNADDATTMPSIVRKLVTVNSGKSIVLTKPCHEYTKTNSVYEIDVDCHNWAYIATKAYAKMHDCIKDLIVDVGFTLHAAEEEELPECVLLCGRINNLHPENISDIST